MHRPPRGRGLPLDATRLMRLAAVVAAHAGVLWLVCSPASPLHPSAVASPKVPAPVEVRLVSARMTEVTERPAPRTPAPLEAPRPPAPGALASATPQTSELPEPPTPSAPVLVDQALVVQAETTAMNRPAEPAPAQPSTPARYDAAYLRNPAPVYPSTARRFGQQGTVLLRVRVTPDGTPAEVELRESSGSAWLDHAALSAVRQWRFVPATQGGQAVAAWVQVPLTFSLGA